MSEQLDNFEEYEKEVNAIAETIEDLLVSGEDGLVRRGAIDALTKVFASLMQVQIQQGGDTVEVAKLRAEKAIGWVASRASNQFLETYGETLFGLQECVRDEKSETDEKES